ncbi:MAG: DNA-processing protein DprA [Flavobacteriales bacterium]
MKGFSENYDEIQHAIAFRLCKGVGVYTALKLIEEFGSAQNIYKNYNVKNTRGSVAERKLSTELKKEEHLKRAEREVEFILKNKITCFHFLDKNYPKRLKLCPDAPLILFGKGNLNLNPKLSLAIVGTRNASEYGKSMCRKIVETLAPFDVTIYSGLAVGIDKQVHQAALYYKLPTVGVLAHGLDRIYPNSHRKLAIQMLEKGGLLTEYITETIPNRENFPMRNRIVAGMADAALVVETATRGGSMITVELAHSYNRDVFAIPGRTVDEFSAGCNKLIKTQKAALVESGEDILYQMGWVKEELEKAVVQKQLFVELNSEEEKIVKLLSTDKPVAFDDLLAETQMPISKLSSLLLNLEFKGVTKPMPGKMYALSY